jgi:hypothetical protein
LKGKPEGGYMARNNALPKKPEWFDLKNYEVCASWDCIKWFGALRVRSQIYDDLKELPKLNLIDWLSHILDIEHFDKVFGLEHCLINRDRRSLSAVEPMSVYSALCIHNKLGKVANGHENVSALKRRLEELDEESIELKKQLINLSYDEEYLTAWNEYFAHAYIILGRAHITVDLNLNDEALIEQFSACIAEMRKRLKWETAPKPLTEKDFSDWYRQRLLPYIDLWLYSEIHECGFTQEDLGAFLFPDELNTDIDLVNRIAKTTRPNALNLLSQTTINALQGQVLKQRPKPVKNGGRPKKKAKTPPNTES